MTHVGAPVAARTKQPGQALSNGGGFRGRRACCSALFRAAYLWHGDRSFRHIAVAELRFVRESPRLPGGVLGDRPADRLADGRRLRGRPHARALARAWP